MTIDQDDTLVGDDHVPRLQPQALARGTSVGRYVLLSKIGEGGMGVVHAAYDPELDRKVAIKVLRWADHGSTSASAGPSRLQREAQALARLSHPNVVSIYDVGTMEDRVWIAMEFVEGTTFADWLTERPRAWEEIVDVMVYAGRGLAAAHAVGLLHRDFKPDNVMVDVEGRTRVMDFGLARPGKHEAHATGSQELPDEEISLPNALSIQLTRTGALLGTPAYMSPEQLRGRADARSDQFSLCVTLWEALYGERPFEGDTLAELTAALLEERRRAPVRGRGVPRWLAQVCARGLARDPDQRFESVDALLAAIERGRLGRRRTRIALGIGAVVVVAAGVDGARRWQQQRAVAACEATGDGVEEVYDDDARDRIRAGLLATGASYAEVTVDKVLPWLDRYADQWRADRVEVCRRGEIEEAFDAPTHARARWCLEEHLVDLAVVVDQYGHADRRVLRNAVDGASGLAPTTVCLDPNVLAGMPDPDPDDRARVLELLGVLGEIMTLDAAGRYDEGFARLDEAAPRAEGLPVVQAKFRMQRGILEMSRGNFAEAEAALVDAYLDAARGGAWSVAAKSADNLVSVVGYRQARFAEGRLWGRLGELAQNLAGDPLGLREARRLERLASLEQTAGDPRAGIELAERAMAIREGVLRSDHPTIGTALANLAIVYHEAGREEEGEQAAQQALAINIEAYGEDHPEVARSLNNLAIMVRTRDADRARELTERALAIRQRVLEPDHPSLADSWDTLGSLHKAQDRPDDAKRAYEKALRIRTEAFGPEHPSVAAVLNNLGNLASSAGRFREAADAYERALEILQSRPDRNPRLESGMAHNLSLAYDYLHEADASILWRQRSLALLEQVAAPDDPALGEAVAYLGESYLRLRRPADAIEAFTRALAIYAAMPEAPTRAVASTRFGLAQAMQAAGRPRPSIVAEARRAIEELDPGATEPSRAEIEAWIDALEAG